ncbi:hypothetical protein HYE56_03865 [Aggregatibacter actinomycetemcomitans]|nr:hypothetical protein [Aggregatibacter actinomycetemcomitans]
MSAKSLLITAEMVDAVSAGKGGNKALLEALNKYSEIYEINTPLRIAHFLAQCAHETNFTTVSEGTIFRKKNARNTYRKYREASPDIQNSICPGSDDSYCKQPELFNFVYGGRMGNNTTGDGYTYRGRGYLQLTGKANYALYKEKHNQFSPGDFKHPVHMVGKKKALNLTRCTQPIHPDPSTTSCGWIWILHKFTSL